MRCSLLTGFQSAIRNRKSAIELAEGVGFEPTRACALPVFKTGAINHSTTPPGAQRLLILPREVESAINTSTALYVHVNLYDADVGQG